MRNKLSMIFIRTIIISALLLTMFIENTRANGPLPYTEDALNKLNSARGKIIEPTDIQGDNNYKVKTYINTYRKIFSTAGYDYDLSIAKVVNDIRSDNYTVNKTTITLNRMARELLKLHVKTGISPRKYLSKECAALLIEFRELIRSNMNKYGGC